MLLLFLVSCVEEKEQSETGILMHHIQNDL